MYFSSITIGIFLLFIGIRFLVIPEAGEVGFGIVFNEAGNYSFHYIKGIRDLFSGVFLLYLLKVRQFKVLGWFLVLAVAIPTVDTWVVLSYNQADMLKTIPHLSAILLCLVTGVYFLVSRQKKVHANETDEVELLTSAQDGQGLQTEIRMRIQAQASTPLHYHDQFQEFIEVEEGELQVLVGNQPILLQEGTSIKIPINTPHKFSNLTSEKCTIKTTLRPGNKDFESAMLIYNYLNNSGKVNKEGIPSSLLHLSVFVTLNNSKFTGLRAPLNLLINAFYTLAKLTGVEKRLLIEAKHHINNANTVVY